MSKREEVADCAEWLWQNREAVTEGWLERTESAYIITAHERAYIITAHERAYHFTARILPKPKFHTMVSVMEAFHAAGPSQYLVGTSNWCNAIAQELNK